MNKQLVIVGIIAILVTAELSGCQESQTDYKPPTSGDTDVVELLNCTIETYGATSSFSSERTKLGDGFIHNSTYNYTYYVIKGNIKNIARYILHRIEITVNFYDKNNNYLANKSVKIIELRRTFTDDFEVSYVKEYPFFDNITQVVIDFKTE
jgi:hypothetical protein